MLSLSAAVTAFSSPSAFLAPSQRAAVHMAAPNGEEALLRRFGLPQDLCTPSRRDFLGLAAGAATIS
eukprot:7048095-Prymnesium_polylepis.1